MFSHLNDRNREFCLFLHDARRSTDLQPVSPTQGRAVSLSWLKLSFSSGSTSFRDWINCQHFLVIEAMKAWARPPLENIFIHLWSLFPHNHSSHDAPGGERQETVQDDDGIHADRRKKAEIGGLPLPFLRSKTAAWGLPSPQIRTNHVAAWTGDPLWPAVASPVTWITLQHTQRITSSMTCILFCIDLKPGGCPGTAQPCKLWVACIVPGEQGSTVKPRWVSGWNVDDMSLTPNQQELFECPVPCLLHLFMHKQQRMAVLCHWLSCQTATSEWVLECHLHHPHHCHLWQNNITSLVLLSVPVLVPWVKQLTEQGWELTGLWACMLRHEGRGCLWRPIDTFKQRWQSKKKNIQTSGRLEKDQVREESVNVGRRRGWSKKSQQSFLPWCPVLFCSGKNTY